MVDILKVKPKPLDEDVWDDRELLMSLSSISSPGTRQLNLIDLTEAQIDECCLSLSVKQGLSGEVKPT